MVRVSFIIQLVFAVPKHHVHLASLHHPLSVLVYLTFVLLFEAR